MSAHFFSFLAFEVALLPAFEAETFCSALFFLLFLRLLTRLEQVCPQYFASSLTLCGKYGFWHSSQVSKDPPIRNLLAIAEANAVSKPKFLP